MKKSCGPVKLWVHLTLRESVSNFVNFWRPVPRHWEHWKRFNNNMPQIDSCKIFEGPRCFHEKLCWVAIYITLILILLTLILHNKIATVVDYCQICAANCLRLCITTRSKRAQQNAPFMRQNAPQTQDITPPKQLNKNHPTFLILFFLLISLYGNREGKYILNKRESCCNLSTLPFGNISRQTAFSESKSRFCSARVWLSNPCLFGSPPNSTCIKFSFGI